MSRVRPSIRNALLSSFVLFAVVPVGLAMTLNYLGSGSAILENFVQGRRAVLLGVAETVRNRIADTEKISDLVYSNQALMELLSARRDGTKPDYELVRQALESFAQFIHYFNSDRYLLSFMVRGQNGLDLRYGLHTAFLDFDAVFASPWYLRGLSSTQPFTWPGLVPGVLTSEPSAAIPLVRPLFDVKLGQRSGTAVLLFQPDLLGSASAVSGEASGTELTVLGPAGVVVYHQPNHPPAEDFPGDNRRIFRDGKAYLQTRVADNGWTLIETAPMEFVERQRGGLLLASVVILLGFGLFVLVVGFYVSRRITRPLERLAGSVAAISRGELEGVIPVEGNDEVGRLGQSIRQMQQEIKNLLDQAIRRERNLKRAEMAALQAQINPHFLSNTLNAIRIMADLQNAKGIASMVKALAGMLQGTFSRTGDDVTVEEELSVLEAYFSILRVRFKGAIRFSVRLEEEDLGKCTLLRFLLQPLVENAVFHGIEPKGTGGEVSITVAHEEDQLKIRVRDDGVGLAPDRRDSLVSTAPAWPEGELNRGVRSGLGIFNIHRRIKIAYGDPYGLSYESEEGRFTCVTVTLPYQRC